MSEIIDDKINDTDIEYIIISKDKNDILNELDFENEEEKLLCDSIITNLEKTAADNIRNMKAVQLPYIGCLRLNPVVQEFKKVKTNLSTIRKNLTKDQYKEHIKSCIIDLREKQIKKDRLKLVLTNIKRKNKKKYEELYKKCGKSYAELYIMSIYWLKDVVFDKEWEFQYQLLSGRIKKEDYE